MSELQGIKWSAPVLIRAERKGLAVSLPQRVIDALQLGVGDVLNFTELPDGAIEVWRVKKSSYASLDAMDKAPAKSKVSTKKKPAKAAKGHSR